MIIRTAEQIYQLATIKSSNHLGQRRIINLYFRRQDESHLYPIFNRFSVVNRAIRQAQAIERANGTMGNYEYALLIENLESEIVNNPKNW